MRKSKDKKIEIREIVYSQDDEKSFGDIFVYEPENVEEQNLGNLFIVGELKDLPRNSSYIVNLIASKIKKEFYSNTKRTAEESLESALSTANQTLSELADQGNGEYVGRLSMVCGTYRESNFFMSQVGKIRSLLVRDGQLLEIVKEDGSKHVSPKRVFNNIASGELADGDFVLFATEGLFNIFSLEQLRKMAVSMEIDDFVVKVQEEIEEEDSEVVSALVLEINGRDRESKIKHTEVVLEDKEYDDERRLRGSVEPEAAPEDAPVVVEPIEEAVTAEIIEEERVSEVQLIAENEILVDEIEAEVRQEPQKTEESIPTAPDEDESGSRIEKSEAEESVGLDAEAAKEPEKISLSDIIKEYEKIENKPKESDVQKDKNIQNIIGKKEDSDFQDLDESQGQSFIKKVAARSKDTIGSIDLGKFKNFLPSLFAMFGKLSVGKKEKEYRIKSAGKKFTFLSKRNVAIALIAVVIVIAGVYPKMVRDKEAKEQAAYYQSMLTESQSKLAEAENDSSEQGAARSFSSAKALALQVKSEYGSLSGEADAVINKAQEELDKIDKVVRTGELQTVAAFDNANVNKLVEVAGTYYAIDGKENVVYKVDAKNGSIAESAKASSKIGEIRMAQNFQNQELIFSDGSSVSSFGLKSAALAMLGTKLGSAAQDFTSYGKYIYVLFPSDNQVYKYQKSGSELTGKTAWMKSGDVSGAVSMAIDQNIYILYSDGQVKKYYTGEEYVENGKKFGITQPSDAITSATKIFTLSDQKNLYVLEAGKGRVLVFDKASGMLLKQLVGDGFSEIKDISVDEKETTLTMLMTNKIVKANL